MAKERCLLTNCGILSLFTTQLRANKMNSDVSLEFSPDQSVLSVEFGSTATRSSAAISRSTLPRPVYKSSFWTSKEVYEASHNPVSVGNIWFVREDYNRATTVQEMVIIYTDAATMHPPQSTSISRSAVLLYCAFIDLACNGQVIPGRR